jgi:hypothetical protein
MSFVKHQRNVDTQGGEADHATEMNEIVTPASSSAQVESARSNLQREVDRLKTLLAAAEASKAEMQLRVELCDELRRDNAILLSQLQQQQQQQQPKQEHDM